MGFMLAKDYSWTEATQAFSEGIEHSKKLDASGEEAFLVYLTDFYLDETEQLCKYKQPNSEEWTTCHKDGSFNIFYLEKFIKENYRFFSKKQLIEMYEDYKLQAARRVKIQCEERQGIKIALEK